MFLYHGRIAFAKVLSFKSMNVCVVGIATEKYRGRYQPIGNRLHFYLHETIYISTLIIYFMVSLSSCEALCSQLFCSLSILCAVLLISPSPTVVFESDGNCPSTVLDLATCASSLLVLIFYSPVHYFKEKILTDLRNSFTILSKNSVSFDTLRIVGVVKKSNHEDSK